MGADHLGHRLQQPKTAVLVHPRCHGRHGLGFHQAVRVKDQRIVVGATRAGDEVLDIAGLAPDIALAPPIEDAAGGLRLAQQQLECRRFLGGDFEGGAVSENGDVEPVRQPEVHQLPVHGRNAGKGLDRVFVVDRHQYGGQPLGSRPGRGLPHRRQRPQNTGQAAPKQPERRDRQQDAAQPVQRGGAIAPDQVQERPACGEARRRGDGEGGSP